MSSDYETRRANAQGRQLACKSAPYPLIGMDISLSKDGFCVADIEIRNPRADDHDVGIEFETLSGKSWRKAQVSWLGMGAAGGYCSVEDYGNHGLAARVYCHESFRDENISTIKERFAQELSQKITRLNEWMSLVEPSAPDDAQKPRRPRP